MNYFIKSFNNIAYFLKFALTESKIEKNQYF